MSKFILNSFEKSLLIDWFNEKNNEKYYASTSTGDVEAIVDEYDDDVTVCFDALGKYKTQLGYRLSTTISIKEEYLTVKEFEHIINRRVSDKGKRLLPPIVNQSIVLHDADNYNRLETIADESIVVIKYFNKREDYSELLSMTVGKYYIARKRIGSSGLQYELLSLNSFERKGTGIIAVNADKNRFLELKIKGYVGRNNFSSGNDTLFPIVHDMCDNVILDVFEGKLIKYEAQPLILCRYRLAEVLNQLSEVRLKGTFFVEHLIRKFNVRTGCATGSSYEDHLQTERNFEYLQHQTHRQTNPPAYPMIMINQRDGEYNVNLIVDEFERVQKLESAILKNHPKQNNHKTDLQCGMDLNFLLI